MTLGGVSGVPIVSMEENGTRSSSEMAVTTGLHKRVAVAALCGDNPAPARREGLRQRIVRRFSVIGPQHGFKVVVDGTAVQSEDRGYYEHMEYCWTHGDQEDTRARLTRLAEGQPSDRTAEVAQSASNQLTITGWIGTVQHPNFLKAEDGENLNRLAVFMRGKVAQEDILGDFGLKEIFADYVVGEIHCDEFDEDDGEDIATSSRQALKHDDSRFEIVRKAVHGELQYIASRWTDLRNRDGARELIAQNDYPDLPLDIVCLVGKSPCEWSESAAGKAWKPPCTV